MMPSCGIRFSPPETRRAKRAGSSSRSRTATLICHRFSVAHDLKLDDVADAALVEIDMELSAVLHHLAIHRQDHVADLAAANGAVLPDLPVDVAYDVARRREADALVASRLREDQRVDANDFALGVEQRSAAVAGIDGRVGLDVDHRRVGLELARHRTHHAHRDGVL